MNEVRSEKPFSPDRDNVTTQDLTSLWTEQLQTAILVYGALTSDEPLTANFAYSPTSVSLALAMTSAGASGESQEQIASTMGFPEQAALHDLMAESTGALLALNHAAVGDPANDGIEAQAVNVVNALWPQADLPIQTPFLDEMSVSYDTGVFPVDYIQATESARLAINGWVSDETNAKIPELVPGGVLSSDTRITLVNAIYLKAPWANTFDPQRTQDASFHGQSSTGPRTVTAPFMHGEVFAKAATVDDDDGTYRVVELGYGHGDLSFVAIFPECPNNTACDVAALAPVPASKLPAALTTTLQESNYNFAMPKFEIRSANSLKDAFLALGMTAPFHGGLDRIADGQDFAVQDIIHEAFIAVDEKGTEAAAATAVIVGPTSIPPSITIDRAFWFVIRDNALGIPLFIGFVADPS